MHTYRERFGVLVGYSGHERGLAPSEAAAALGACVIERHFTVDRTMTGAGVTTLQAKTGGGYRMRLYLAP